MNYIAKFAVLFIFFMLCDLFWIGFLMKSLYAQWIGVIMRSSLMLHHLAAGFLVWGLIILGIMHFLLPHAYEWSMQDAFGQGAAFGLVVYGVYELTNYMFLREWPWIMVVCDTIWGSFVCGLTVLFAKFFFL